MAHVSVNTSGLPRTWLPAILISGVVSLLCAGALYFILAQQDRLLVAQRNAAAIEQWTKADGLWCKHSPRSVNRCWANISPTCSKRSRDRPCLPICLTPPSSPKTTSLWRPATRLRGSANNCGTRNGWPRAIPGLDLSRSESRRGQPALIVIEPLRQQEHIIGWVRFLFAAPQEVARATRSEGGPCARCGACRPAAVRSDGHTPDPDSTGDDEPGSITYRANSSGGTG